MGTGQGRKGTEAGSANAERVRAMERTILPEVVQAVPGDGYTLYAYFNDGTVHQYDVSPLLSRGGVFERLRDPAFFRQAMTVMNGTVAWDFTGMHDPMKCLDLDPLVLYQAKTVDDPLDDHHKLAS